MVLSCRKGVEVMNGFVLRPPAVEKRGCHILGIVDGLIKCMGLLTVFWTVSRTLTARLQGGRIQKPSRIFHALAGANSMVKRHCRVKPRHDERISHISCILYYRSKVWKAGIESVQW